MDTRQSGDEDPRPRLLQKILSLRAWQNRILWAFILMAPATVFLSVQWMLGLWIMLVIAMAFCYFRRHYLAECYDHYSKTHDD